MRNEIYELLGHKQDFYVRVCKFRLQRTSIKSSISHLKQPRTCNYMQINFLNVCASSANKNFKMLTYSSACCGVLQFIIRRRVVENVLLGFDAIYLLNILN